MDNSPATEDVELVNPLPITLSHYERALREVLATSVEWRSVSSSTPSIEIGDVGVRRRLTRGVTVLSSRVRHTSDRSSALVLWPAFGLADPASWVLRRGRVWVVVHDPAALRRQFGMGTLASGLGAWASRRGVGVLVHSEVAREELQRHRWTTQLLPHPMERPREVGTEGRFIAVLGQWKPARTLEPLHVLADDSGLHGRRVVIGRGWPRVAGWLVEDRFLDDDQFDAAIDDAACVVLPYDQYFQSGVAVRALERLTPVVGLPHPFLASLFGEDWPGFVDAGDWAGAVRRVMSVSRTNLLTLRQEYWEHCVQSWRLFGREL